MTATSPLLLVRRPAIALEIGLDVAALAFLPILVMVPHGVAPLIAVAGVLALALALPLHMAVLQRFRGAAALAVLLVLWGAVSAVWAIEPGRSLLIATRLTGLFAAGFALILAADRVLSPKRLVTCALAGIAIALVLIEIQFASGGWLTRPFFVRPFVPPKLNQAVNALAILILPLAATLVLRRRAWFGFFVALAVMVVIYHLVGTAAKVAFTAAIVCSALLYFWGRRFAYAVVVLSVLVIVAAPWSFPRLIQLPVLAQSAQELKFSAIHRLLIWSFVGARIDEHPLRGWGLDASRSIPGGNIEIHPGAPWLPLHPHNSALQVWLELGLPGAVLFALLMILLWRAVAKISWPPLFKAAAGGSLLMTFVASFGTYGIWQEWWIATMWLALFLILLMARIVSGEAGENAAATPWSERRPVQSRT